MVEERLNGCSIAQPIAFPEILFNAVYAINATAHALSVYEQFHRVPKFSVSFVVFERVMTNKYYNMNPQLRAIRLDIKCGDSIANMTPQKHALQAISGRIDRQV